MKKWLIFIGCIVLFGVPFSIKPDDEQVVPSKVKEDFCEVFITVEGQSIPLETYIVGVVAAEMPASFQLEALKAQAIAARTYALKKTEFGQVPIQTTTAHQVYETKEERAEKWQAVSTEYETKIEQAVRETEGLIATYEGELITAMFHSASSGKTESATNYSGNSLPYLQSVASSEKVEKQQQTYTVHELNKQLGSTFTLKDYAQVKIRRNDSGRVETLQIVQQTWSGRTFRELLGLRSTQFILLVKGEKIVIETEGYGHGVGMSQYGANEMASQGIGAAEIMKHYYQGINIEPYKCKKDV